MRITVAVRQLTPRFPFRISRGEKRVVENVFVRIDNAGICGYGEASPNAFYGETASATAELLRAVGPSLEGEIVECPEDIARLWERCGPALAPSRAAQCALDLALWDLAAKRKGVPVSVLALNRDSAPVTTFCTIGLSDEAGLRNRLPEIAGFPRVKIKSDASADIERIAMIATHAQDFAVDANGAWTTQQTAQNLPTLKQLGALFLEQPLHPDLDAHMPKLLENAPLPILADESCVTADDVMRVSGRFSGFNIKLVKCGGLTPALEMLRHGRELGLEVMTGCMLESSLLIAAGMVIGALSDHADLDGAWLLGDDPFSGVVFDAGILRGSGRSGFGVTPEEGLFPD